MHRVQRIGDGKSKQAADLHRDGRLLPEAEEVDVKITPTTCASTSSGHGGQYINKDGQRCASHPRASS